MDQPKKAKRPRPTMQAIANQAGVSRSTVSHILACNTEFIERIRPETVARVREIARELGYQVNLMALSLRAPHPSFYGLILRGEDTAETISWHHQAFEAQFQAGALEASRALGLYPVLATLGSAEPESALTRVRGVLDGGVLGAVIRSPLPAPVAPLCQQIEMGLPLVVVFPAEDAYLPTNCIDLDNVATGTMAARLLLAANRRKLMLVQEERNWTAVRLRAEGFVAAAQAAGAEVRAEIMADSMTPEQGEAWLAARFRETRPDGIYATSAGTGVEAIMACQTAGLRVPDEVALVGTDTGLWRTPGCLTITSVDVSWYEAGELAVRKMIELEGTDPCTLPNIHLRPQVRAGGTCPVFKFDSEKLGQ